MTILDSELVPVPAFFVLFSSDFSDFIYIYAAPNFG